MRETPQEITDLQALMDATMAHVNPHFASIVTPRSRLTAQQVVTHLQDAGLEVALFGQGFVSMNAPSKHLDVLVRSGSLRHGGHPVLSWNASNLMWEKDAADNWKPSKKKSREKIDGMTALIMAIGVALALPGAGPSIEDALLSGEGVLA